MADQTVKIENIDELAGLTHKCTASETLIDIQVKLGRLDENVKSMATSNLELNREMRQFMQTGHVCRYKKEIEMLMSENQKKAGSDYWVDKFVESVKYILLFVMGMFIAFVLKGGHLT